MASYANKHTNQKKSDTKSVLSQQSKNSDQHKIDLVNKMQQNEEKHKQLMLDNRKRRKEKERQLKNQEEQKLKEQAEALQNRKKTKEQAYVNYLRHNSKNILAEFKQEKYVNAPKAQSNPIKQGPQINNNFEALDLEISQLSKNKNLYKDFKQPEFEVLRQSELLDSLDLSSCKSKRQITKEIPKDPPILAQLVEQNSESEEDDLWNQTFKNGKINHGKKAIQPEVTWTEQIVNQADDVLSKMSAKNRSKSPISREVQKEVPKEQKYKETKSTSQTKDIRQQQHQEINSQKPKVTKPQPITQIEPTQNKRPPVNVKITQRKPQVQSQNSNDERAHIQEFLSEDLVNLNSAEVQLQKELSQLNKENKVKGPYEQNEDQIEASLIRLDQRLIDLGNRKSNDIPQSAEVIVHPYKETVQQVSQQQRNDKKLQQHKSVATPEKQQPNNNQRHTSQQQQISKPPLIQQQQQATTPEMYSHNINQRGNVQQQQSYKPPQIQQQQYIPTDQQQQLDYQQFLIEQQNVLKQQLYDAQMKLYDQEQQNQQKALSQQSQSQQQNRLDLPKFPEYTIHPDHQSLISLQTQYSQKETNLRPRNVITHEAQNSSIVSSQQSDKYNFDIDFGGIKTQNTYQKQAEKRTHQKHSQVHTPIKELPEEGEGKIEVRQDLKQLLFD